MSSNKRYNPSRKKLLRARRNGDVAKSRDLTGACQLVVGLAWCAWALYCCPQVTDFLEECADRRQDFHTNNMLVSLGGAFATWGALELSLLGLLWCAAVLTQAAQVGVFFCWSSLELRWSRLNLIPGFGRILGIQPGAESLLPSGLIYEVCKTCGLLVLLVGSGGLMIAFLIKPLYAARLAAPEEVQTAVALALLKVTSPLIAAAVLIGGGDLLLARFRRSRRLMMDAQELKRELRESEGNPELKGLRKQAHQELLHHGSLNAIRRASLVVVGRVSPPGRQR
ncbi:MAG: EscU/YscU/HrcU family type III secretion system export apparatus switch protein [Bdellovibrionota bacterium]